MLFLKLDTTTWAYLKIDMRHGNPSDKQQGIFLKSTCDMGPGDRTVGEHRQGHR